MPKSSTSTGKDFTTHELSSPEAERAYLGLVILENQVLTAFSLRSDDFFSFAHRTIFEFMVEMASEKRHIDMVTLSERLSRGKKLDQVGGAEYITGLTEGVPIGFSGSGEEYARIIKEWERPPQDAPRKSFPALCGGISRIPGRSLPSSRRGNQTRQTRKRSGREEREAPVSQLPAGSSKAAWYGPCELYRRAMEKSTNASHNYHLACFLTVVGALLGKTILTEEGGDEIYPNLFTVVVGEAGGAKKDTAVNRAMGLLKSIDKEVVRLSGIASVQGFLLEMQSEQKELEDAKVDGPLRVLIRLREFHTLINTASQKATNNLAYALRVLRLPRRDEESHGRETLTSARAGRKPLGSLKPRLAQVARFGNPRRRPRLADRMGSGRSRPTPSASRKTRQAFSDSAL